MILRELKAPELTEAPETGRDLPFDSDTLPFPNTLPDTDFDFDVGRGLHLTKPMAWGIIPVSFLKGGALVSTVVASSGLHAEDGPLASLIIEPKNHLLTKSWPSLPNLAQ